VIVYRSCRDFPVEILDGEALVWDGEALALHHLDGATTAVWLACDEWSDIEDIAVRVGPGRAADEAERAEIATILTELEARHLLRSRSDDRRDDL
jgi:hypothetical protein